MEIVSVITSQITIMFLLMAVGFILFKLKVITNTGNEELSNILIRLVVPCAIIKAYLTSFSHEKLINLGMTFLFVGIAFLIAIIVARVFCRPQGRIDEFGAIISNAGFVGIPLVQATLGTEAVFYMSAYMVVLNILMWTYGLYILTGSTDCLKPKKIIFNPVVIASILGLIIFFIPFPLPVIVNNSIDFLSGMLTPLAMIVSGVYLAQTDLKKVVTNKKLYISSLVGLVLIPGILIVALMWVPPQFADVRMVVLIGAAVPSGSVLPVFAHMAGRNEGKAVQLLCQSTLLSIVSLPLIIWVATMVWGLI